MIQKADHIDMVVKDLGKSVKFYKDLGFVEEGRFADGTVILKAESSGEPPLTLDLHEAASGEQTRIDHISFQEPEIEAMCRNLEAKGYTFRQPLIDFKPSGRLMAKLYDPDGVCISITKQVGKINFSATLQQLSEHAP